MDGTANGPFAYTRIGFCVLHPDDECAGQEYSGAGVAGPITRKVARAHRAAALRERALRAARGAILIIVAGFGSGWSCSERSGRHRNTQQHRPAVKDANHDLVIALATPAYQAMLNVTKTDGKPPFVFNCIVDPYAAAKDIVKSPTEKPFNVTGLQSMPPVEDAMRLAQRCVPTAKRVGIIWNPSEANSVVVTGIARRRPRNSASSLSIRPSPTQARCFRPRNRSSRKGSTSSSCRRIARWSHHSKRSSRWRTTTGSRCSPTIRSQRSEVPRQHSGSTTNRWDMRADRWPP